MRMRSVIYALLSAEGSLESQMVCIAQKAGFSRLALDPYYVFPWPCSEPNKCIGKFPWVS